MLTAWAMPANDETTSWSLSAHKDCKGTMLTAGLGLPMMKQPHQMPAAKNDVRWSDCIGRNSGMNISAVIVENNELYQSFLC